MKIIHASDVSRTVLKSLLSERALPSHSVNRINRAMVATTGEIPSGMQLIRDTWPLKIKDSVMVESANGRGQPVMRITGLFQEADKKNSNNRVYPLSILREAVEQIQEDVVRRSVLGECDHPQDAKIHLDRVSHLITKIWMDGKKVYGEAEVLDRLPCGGILRGLFEHKIEIGISSRGVGDMDVRESGGEETYYVQPGFRVVTWDAVAEPSVVGATLSVCESRARLRATAKRGMFSQATYDAALVAEIKRYFS